MVNEVAYHTERLEREGYFRVKTCEVCGMTSRNIHEYPTYSKVLGRDTTEYQCDEINECLGRKYKEEK